MAKLAATNFHDLAQFIEPGTVRRLGHNTVVYRTEAPTPDDPWNGYYITLHGYPIFDMHQNVLTGKSFWEFTLAGWSTVTTRDRINQLLPAGYRVVQRDWVQYLICPDGNWVELDSTYWYSINDHTVTCLNTGEYVNGRLS